MKKLSMPASITRRTFLQVSAAGVVTASSLGSVGRAFAEPYSRFTWISPHGTLEVLDDYAYWIGKKMGYFDDLGIESERIADLRERGLADRGITCLGTPGARSGVPLYVGAASLGSTEATTCPNELLTGRKSRRGSKRSGRGSNVSIRATSKLFHPCSESLSVYPRT
jgi:hypothetical protein